MEKKSHHFHPCKNWYFFFGYQEPKHGNFMEKSTSIRRRFKTQLGVTRKVGGKVSHEKNPYYFPLYCLFNRDPYFMVHYNAYITGEYNALYTPTNHGFFHCSGGVEIRHGCSMWTFQQGVPRGQCFGPEGSPGFFGKRIFWEHKKVKTIEKPIENKQFVPF